MFIMKFNRRTEYVVIFKKKKSMLVMLNKQRWFGWDVHMGGCAQLHNLTNNFFDRK